jgi:hypothetical protein
VHPSLLPAANRLAAFHQSQYGYTDAVITTTQFYNEFSGGIPDPGAIRNGIKLFYDLSKPLLAVMQKPCSMWYYLEQVLTIIKTSLAPIET